MMEGDEWEIDVLTCVWLIDFVLCVMESGEHTTTVGPIQEVRP